MVGNGHVFIEILGSIFTCTCFLPSSLASLTEMCSFWHYLKDLFPLHKYKMTNLSLTVKTDDITNGTVIMDPNCQLWMVQEQMG